MRYIQRQSMYARSLHWIHTIACLSLYVTGLILFIPAVAAAVGPTTVQGARMIHRVMAAIFIIAPVVSIAIQPKGFVHVLKGWFFKWDEKDKEFMAKFPKYLFLGGKEHMPDQKYMKSGQAIADIPVVVLSIAIALSGIVLVWPDFFGGGSIVRWSLLIHDGVMVLLGVMMIAHIYIGAGIFQPYKGSGRIMFGDGKVSEADALYHWGTWAREVLKAGGKDVTTE
ncbi:MAG: cytochrome b/b6 domain-containing protein [Coriobacteriia bacterium]|nr:cytochrome b/b6 domain-containing protein [Coriobacteriia bacterium]